MSANMNLKTALDSQEKLGLKTKLSIVTALSMPAILAQISEILMQYIDAAMVGSLGAEASASIGLVSSSTWLIGGLMSACAAGFAVQAAHAIGASNYPRARKLLKEGLIAAGIFSLFLTSFGLFVSPHLPVWLGADVSIHHDAAMYFSIFCAFTPVRLYAAMCMQMLACTGNMKTPAKLQVLACAADVVFNYFLIYPTHSFRIFGASFIVPSAGLGVAGAALGTGLSVAVAAVPVIYIACVKSPALSLKGDQSRWSLEKEDLIRARNIAVPMGCEQAALSLAQVVSTAIVAPLGTIAIAANSFAVTAEAICYMPGYGIGSAATTMVGQAIGAKRKDLARSFAWLTVISGMVLMGIVGMIMYFICPFIFMFLTPVQEVRDLAQEVLRIELLAEPLFAASIIASAALRGAGDTMIPAILNLVSIWGVRLTLAWILSKSMGLRGVWIAMMVELCFRGVLFLIRLKREGWLKRICE
ncbi:MAG: MATE family efflux transporter [Erysipelotrichia bacterium]|nr:MATE family efflux transporter [Erysipelotrichia bacterium]